MFNVIYEHANLRIFSKTWLLQQRQLKTNFQVNPMSKMELKSADIYQLYRDIYLLLKDKILSIPCCQILFSNCYH